ncbi:MAG: acetoacetate decarboxylase family protein [Calothrix sp. C42_A2020_038]|nr:acetoacetate decarboxylase family protein [Calothrix sp. C42_A2020_038]
MAYPMAPWNLQGYAVQTVHLIDTKHVRGLIPSEFEIFSVFPGKTVGGLYVSNYQAGSVLEYNELIVIPGLVKYKDKIGGWVSHIYVDNPDSVAGGREIWGLPKELADFTWLDKRVFVQQAGKTVFSLDFNKQSWMNWRLTLGWSSFSTKERNILSFPFGFEFNLGLISSKLEVPHSSPFASLNLGAPLLTAWCKNLNLRVDAPQIVGNCAANYTYS